DVVDRVFHAWPGMTADDVEIVTLPKIVLRERLRGGLHRPEPNRSTPPERSGMLTDGAVVIQLQHLTLVLDSDGYAFDGLDWFSRHLLFLPMLVVCLRRRLCRSPVRKGLPFRKLFALFEAMPRIAEAQPPKTFALIR